MRFTGLMLTLFILSLASVSSSFAEIGEARNFYQFNDQVLTSGQPDQMLLEEVAEDGIEVVINLVPSAEPIYNPKEAKIIKNQGVKYIHTPVSWSAPTKSELQSFLAIMKANEDKKVLVHCWSNARASALIYAYKVSKAPESQQAEYQNLKKIWKTVAGYDLEANQAWSSFLKEHVGKAH